MNEIKINGTLENQVKQVDTIYFSKGFIPKEYFEQDFIATKTIGGIFNFKINNLSYPHLYKVNLESEKDDIVFRAGNYFIDSTSNQIIIAKIGECSLTNGKHQKEYIEKFIPFVTGTSNATYDCSRFLLSNLLYNDVKLYDKKLLEYIVNSPNSFVALWLLIEQIETIGYDKVYREALNQFSPKMKKQKLWEIANKTLTSIKIIEGESFPELSLKNINLDSEKLKLSTAKYTLIDFWFSTCKPCLESFPKLKILHNKYKKLGFEVIGISVDKTKNINKWVSKIEQYELTWSQYLDENEVEAGKNRISSYPTTYLVDKNGVVLKKNISMIELEQLLDSTLND